MKGVNIFNFRSAANWLKEIFKTLEKQVRFKTNVRHKCHFLNFASVSGLVIGHVPNQLGARVHHDLEHCEILD